MAPNNSITDLFGINGLVVVITGGGSGLGLYAARALDANGAKAVYIVGRREQTLKEAAKTAVNGNIIPIVGDAGKKEDILRVAEQVRKEQGFVNLLFANAGVSGPPAAKPLGAKPSIKEFQEIMLNTDLEDYTFTQQVNNTAVFLTAVAFMDLLDAGNQKRNVPQDSQILVTSSIAGLSRHLSHGFAYSTSKASVNHLVKMLATYFAQHEYHIRANVICPGFYPSEMTSSTMEALESYPGHEQHPGVFADARKMEQKNSPAERTGSEEDFAGLILFLASRAGAYCNGQVMVTDGGRLSQLPSAY